MIEIMIVLSLYTIVFIANKLFSTKYHKQNYQSTGNPRDKLDSSDIW